MDRKEFLKTLGISGAALFATYCLGSCGKKDEAAPATVLPDGGLTLDLNTATYSPLKTNGGFVILSAEKIVVARTNTGTYVAVTRVCSHQGNEQVSFLPNENLFECSAHGARFSTTGSGLNANGSNGLRTYRTEINQAGDSLRIFNS